MMKWDEDAKIDDNRWDLKRVRETARLECPHCAGHLTDALKTKMLREGEWRAENLGALPGHRSYHLSALYSVRRSFGALRRQIPPRQAISDGLARFRQQHPRRALGRSHDHRERARSPSANTPSAPR